MERFSFCRRSFRIFEKSVHGRISSFDVRYGIIHTISSYKDRLSDFRYVNVPVTETTVIPTEILKMTVLG